MYKDLVIENTMPPPLPPSLSESTHNLSSMVTQMQFLTSVQTKLKDPSSADQLLTDLKHLRERLTSPDNLRIVMATNVNSLPHANPLDPWLGFLPQSSPKR